MRGSWIPSSILLLPRTADVWTFGKVDLPETVRTASALCLTPALLWATQHNLPLSLPRTPVICRTPVGSSVNLWSWVSTGTPSFSQLMCGSGRPWIWHWNRATPNSSTCTDSGWTWKSAMAAEGWVERERKG